MRQAKKEDEMATDVMTQQELDALVQQARLAHAARERVFAEWNRAQAEWARAYTELECAQAALERAQSERTRAWAEAKRVWGEEVKTG